MMATYFDPDKIEQAGRQMDCYKPARTGYIVVCVMDNGLHRVAAAMPTQASYSSFKADHNWLMIRLYEVGAADAQTQDSRRRPSKL